MTRGTLSLADTGPVSVFPAHEKQLRNALSNAAQSRTLGDEFEPAFELCEATPRLLEFFSVSDIKFAELGTVGDSRLVLFDLMGNPGARTVKTLASHVIVARAVHHIHETAEPIMILTPSSANKATALRDAVLRAIEVGLVTSEQLQIVTLVPDLARPKLWSSALTTDPQLAGRNPMCVLAPEQPAHVKTLARQVITEYAGEFFERTGIRLWHTLDLANYQCADAFRAFVEQAAIPQQPGTSRAHAHSVSSAFGLLGHHFGTTLLEDPPPPAQYFLVQQLDTPDMVDSLYGITAPGYDLDPEDGLYRQDGEPHYPAVTADPAEVLETTFYTRSPATSPAMNEIIGRQGGGGVVVSKHECLQRYDEIRELLANAGHALPQDPDELREWSLVMVMTGVLNGIERGLLDTDEVIVHGSGSYSATDYTPIPEHALHRIETVADLRRVIDAAAAGTAAASC